MTLEQEEINEVLNDILGQLILAHQKEGQILINVPAIDKAKKAILASLTEAHKDNIREIIKMSDQLELECGKDGDKGTKQWMAFKGFRNAIRDKFNIEVK
jgi:hypothetical protein